MIISLKSGKSFATKILLALLLIDYAYSAFNLNNAAAETFSGLLEDNPLKRMYEKSDHFETANNMLNLLGSMKVVGKMKEMFSKEEEEEIKEEFHQKADPPNAGQDVLYLFEPVAMVGRIKGVILDKGEVIKEELHQKNDQSDMGDNVLYKFGPATVVGKVKSVLLDKEYGTKEEAELHQKNDKSNTENNMLSQLGPMSRKFKDMLLDRSEELTKTLQQTNDEYDVQNNMLNLLRPAAGQLKDVLLDKGKEIKDEFKKKEVHAEMANNVLRLVGPIAAMGGVFRHVGEGMLDEFQKKNEESDTREIMQNVPEPIVKETTNMLLDKKEDIKEELHQKNDQFDVEKNILNQSESTSNVQNIKSVLLDERDEIKEEL